MALFYGLFCIFKKAGLAARTRFGVSRDAGLFTAGSLVLNDRLKS
jgi:hypothetical protein